MSWFIDWLAFQTGFAVAFSGLWFFFGIRGPSPFMRLVHRKPQITVADFDTAVKCRWSPDTCIIAQYELRAIGKTSSFSRGDLVFENNKALIAMDVFDRNFKRPGDEQKPRLQELRKSLPIDL